MAICKRCDGEGWITTMVQVAEDDADSVEEPCSCNPHMLWPGDFKMTTLLTDIEDVLHDTRIYLWENGDEMAVRIHTGIRDCLERLGELEWEPMKVVTRTHQF
jgi:hypothetical protein